MRNWWKHLRTTYYYHTVGVPSVPEGEDATSLLQGAINEAQRCAGYKQALKVYESRRLKWLHRKPVLIPTVQLSLGRYSISRGLVGGPGLTIRGADLTPSTKVV
jgi:hypothetical protein